MSELEQTKCAYVLWRDYGTEGWHPYGYATEQDVLEAISSGLSEGFVVTRAAMVLRLEPDARYE